MRDCLSLATPTIPFSTRASLPPGKGLDDLYKKRWERIAKIKERGKLRSDSEFCLINEHIDYLINMGAPDEETELFDSMLFDYEERARKRRERREKQKKDKS